MKSEKTTIQKLYKNLTSQKRFAFPEKGKPLNVPCTHGVYIIRKGNKALHVGRTHRGKKGLHQRLSNHLHGASSFAIKSLGGVGEKLRKDYTYQYLEVKSDRQRALLEAYAVGTLCPVHLGLGN
jgi:hypothetical protein